MRGHVAHHLHAPYGVLQVIEDTQTEYDVEGTDQLRSETVDIDIAELQLPVAERLPDEIRLFR